VHRLVHESGLDGYYDLKDEHTAPADPSVFQPRDHSWLKAAQAEEERDAVSKGRIPLLLLSIQGISCAGCVWLIERLFTRQPGALDIMVNAQTGEMRLRFEAGVFSAENYARLLQSFGYLAGPPGDEPDDSEARGLVRRMGLCGAFMMNVTLFVLPGYFGMEPGFEYARLFATISMAFGTLSLLVGGSYFIGRAVRLLGSGELHIDLPIAIGILGAYLGSLYGWLAHDPRFEYWDFVSTFILLMLTGRWAQVIAVERNQRQLLRQQIRPPRLKAESQGGALVEIAPEKITTGMCFKLPPGQALPVDSRLREGEASLSLASINGESEPRSYRAGELLPSGALNIGLTELELEARQSWSDSLLARLLQQPERKGWRQRLLELIIRGYLIGILIAAAGGGIIWWLCTHDLHRTWSVVTAVLVVSCPCAIGLAFPLAEEMAATALRRRGVYVRENDLWARLQRVRKIIFDKTGTLTLETPELANPELLPRLDDQARSALHTLASASLHPLSQSLLAELLASGGAGRIEGRLTETTGSGVACIEEDGTEWRLGKPSWAAPTSMETGQAGQAATVVLSRSSVSIAAFSFHDHARADAADEMDKLRKAGFTIHILSGDAPEKVNRMAAQLGLPEGSALGAQSPQDKAAWMENHDKTDTLMLGDGANDSLAFEKALCRGTPVIHRGLLEQRADFFYLGRGISGIRCLFAIDRIRRRTQTAIMVFSVGYNALAVGLALAGLMNPLVAAVLMPLNSLLTLLIVSGGMRKAFTTT